MVKKFAKNDEGVSAVIGVILMVAITVILAAVIAAFVFGMVGGVQQKKNVAFTIKRTTDASVPGNVWVDITLSDMGGAATITGLTFTSPDGGIASSQPTFDATTVLGVGDTFHIDTGIATSTGSVHLIAYSTVDGNQQVVIDSTV